MKWGGTYNDEGQLSSGREFYTNNRIIGLKPGDTSGFWYGFDGGQSTEDWTLAERAELADYMIALWTTFRNAAP